MIIGITGKAGHGKDTVADLIVEMLDPLAVKKSWAQPVKDMAQAIDPLIEGSKRLSDFLDNPEGWHAAKKHPEVRRFLQRLGTEGGRGVLGDRVWINHLLDQYYERDTYDHDTHFVIPDTRFPNEAMHCDVLIRVVRPNAPSLGANATHASEQYLDAEYEIINDSTIAFLRSEVQEIIRSERLG